MGKLRLLLLALAIQLFTSPVIAQTVPPVTMGSEMYYFLNGTRFVNYVYAPRKDTVISDLRYRAPGMLTWHPTDQKLYYRDSTHWIPILRPGDVPSINISNTDMTLTGNRRLSGASNNYGLTFDSLLYFNYLYKGTGRYANYGLISAPQNTGLFQKIATRTNTFDTMYVGVGFSGTLTPNIPNYYFGFGPLGPGLPDPNNVPLLMRMRPMPTGFTVGINVHANTPGEGKLFITKSDAGTVPVLGLEGVENPANTATRNTIFTRYNQAVTTGTPYTGTVEFRYDTLKRFTWVPINNAKGDFSWILGKDSTGTPRQFNIYDTIAATAIKLFSLNGTTGNLTLNGNITATAPTSSGPGEFIIRNTSTGLWERIALNSFNPPVTVTGATYNVTTSNYRVYCNTTSNAITLNLPDAATVTNTRFIVKKITNNANTVTIDPFSTQTIDDASTYVISTYNTTIVFASDGTNWKIE